MTKENEIENTYTVTVDYTRTVKQAIEAGDYDSVSDSINSKNFPESQAKQGIERAQQKNKVPTQITLIHLNRIVTTDEALKELDQKGYRPANLYELLALGAQQQDLQRTNLIVGLGSSWVLPWGGRSVPCLGRFGSRRGVGLDWAAYDWDVGWRFAASWRK